MRYSTVMGSYRSRDTTHKLPVNVEGDVVLKFQLRGEAGVPNYEVFGEDGLVYFRTEWSPEAGKIHFQYLKNPSPRTYEAFAHVETALISSGPLEFLPKSYTWIKQDNATKVSAVFFERNICGLTKLLQLTKEGEPPVATLDTSSAPYRLILTRGALDQGFLHDCIMSAPFIVDELPRTFKINKAKGANMNYNVSGPGSGVLYFTTRVHGNHLICLGDGKGQKLLQMDASGSSWCYSEYGPNFLMRMIPHLTSDCDCYHSPEARGPREKCLNVNGSVYTWKYVGNGGFKVSAIFFEHSSCDLTKLRQLYSGYLELASLTEEPLFLKIDQHDIESRLLYHCILSVPFVIHKDH